MEQSDSLRAEPETRKRPPTPGSWKPGQSGNPKGRRGRATSLIDAIREGVDVQEMLAIALNLARTGNESTQLQALNWLRDSGFVRPADRHEVGPPGSTDEPDELPDALTPDELREILVLERRRDAIIAAAEQRDGDQRNFHSAITSSSEQVLQLTESRPSIRPSDGGTVEE